MLPPRRRPGSPGWGGAWAWLGTKCCVYILGGEARWGRCAALLPSHMRCLYAARVVSRSGMDIPHIAALGEKLASAGSPAPTLPHAVSGSS